MNFNLTETTQILERTPGVLRALLDGLADGWTVGAADANAWSPFDVLGHLIHGERTDWIPRARIILERGETEPFTPFDRFAQEPESRGKALGELLDTFEALRGANLKTLAGMAIDEERLQLTGNHPALGRVTLAQLLSAWTVHDLAHLGQIARTMARRYRADVGPWSDPEYFRILQ